MSNRWDSKGVPHKGWVGLGVEDLGAPDHSCEMCGNRSVRYVHTMFHPDHNDYLRVGCDCAEKMSNDYVTPKTREREAKNRAQRRAAWPEKKWRTSKKGNPWLKYQGLIFTVFPQGGRWRYSASEGGEKPDFSAADYATALDAKLGIFDTLYPPFKPPPFPKGDRTG